ncbi:MAG: D-glycerate dehydrogenase [Lachnospiraceae bacterium]|nr:D-glycerate dehydrogenase [Lachnospiraceae bacterium]
MEKLLVTSAEYAKANRAYTDEVVTHYQAEVIYNTKKGAMDEEALIQTINAEQITGLLVYSSSDEVTGHVLKSCPTLRAISRHGVGMENIDVNTAKSLGMAVVNTSNAHDYEAVADLVLADMLAIARKVPAFDKALKGGEWNRIPASNVWGKTLGIIGYGRIGKAVADRAKAFRMKIVAASSRGGSIAGLPEDIEELSKEELLAKSDFVSLHCRLTDETRGLIGEKELRSMKSSAYLINTGRAGLVDANALLTAVKEGWIAGAATDVFEKEPTTDDPLITAKLDNLLVTPHVGIYTEETLREIDILAMENLLFALSEQK